MKKSKDILTIISCSLAALLFLALIAFSLFLAVKNEIADPDVQSIDWVLVGTLVLTLGLYVNLFFSKFVNACKSVHAKRKAIKAAKKVKTYKPFN